MVLLQVAEEEFVVLAAYVFVCEDGRGVRMEVGVVWGGVGVGLGGCCRVCTVEMVGRGVAWVRW